MSHLLWWRDETDNDIIDDSKWYCIRCVISIIIIDVMMMTESMPWY